MNYLEGIAKEEQAGRITYRETIDDDFSHLPPGGVLAETNTRRLDYGIVPLLSNLEPDARILALGTGTGRECKDIRDHATDATIHTVALTPFNPYMLPRQDAYLLLREVIAMNEEEHEKRRKETDRYKRTGDRSFRVCASNYMSAAYVMELAEAGRMNIFRVFDKSCVDHQFIGQFLQQAELKENSYDVIYEQLGPIYYDKREGGIHADFNNRSLQKANALLKETGMLYLKTKGAPAAVFDKEYQQYYKPNIFLDDSDRMLMLKPRSPLYQPAIDLVREPRFKAEKNRYCEGRYFIPKERYSYFLKACVNANNREETLDWSMFKEVLKGYSYSPLCEWAEEMEKI